METHIKTAREVLAWIEKDYFKGTGLAKASHLEGDERRAYVLAQVERLLATVHGATIMALLLSDIFWTADEGRKPMPWLDGVPQKGSDYPINPLLSLQEQQTLEDDEMARLRLILEVAGLCHDLSLHYTFNLDDAFGVENNFWASNKQLVEWLTTTEYENMNFAKVDLVAKYMNNTSVIVTYKFVITNNGDVTGYVESLKDNLPSGLEFSSELNKDWYRNEDGSLYTSALNGIAIEPGKSSEIELILTKETTEESTGTFKNNAELMRVNNIEAIEESSSENNKSSADLVISIKTGSPLLYIGITLASITVVALGAYIIKKKILNRGI